MIKFGLVCDSDHDFEAWFSSSDDYEKQRKRGLVLCPFCDSKKVQKALMAPSVSTSRQRESVAVAKMSVAQIEMMTEMKKLRDKITANADNMGEKFPEEARKIHYGEAEERGIYGAAKPDEVKDLLEEGIAVAPLPPVPEDAN